MNPAPTHDAEAPTLTRSMAMRCLWVNLLVLPGAGSIKAGRRVGWLQLLMLVAGLMMFAPLALHALDKVLDAYRGVAQLNESTTPADETGMDWQQARAQITGILDQWGGMAMGGMAMVMAAWGWALITSVSLIIEAAKAEPPR
ncbi:MAG: hypothetical protein EXS28_10570 [Pedosphaera sp.]|nr:hypothetical protein [Pedosphaera sp.]